MIKDEYDVLLTECGAVQTGMNMRRAAARKNGSRTGRMVTTSRVCYRSTESCGIAVARNIPHCQPIRSEGTGEYGNVGDATDGVHTADRTADCSGYQVSRWQAGRRVFESVRHRTHSAFFQITTSIIMIMFSCFNFTGLLTS